MLNPIIILIITQTLFTTSDLIGRYFMSKNGFIINNFISIWFVVYMLIRTIATFGQLFIFTQFGLGKTMALFGAVSLILSTTLAFLLFKETINPSQYIGISLVVLAFLVLAFIK